MERDQDAMFLGAVLRRARLAAGITSQDELADKLGYERTVITKAESGQRPPSPDVARAYAREFPQLNALIETGLIEEWAEHVRNNGGSFPTFFVDWVEAEKNAATLLLLGSHPGAGHLAGRVVRARDPGDSTRQ